MESDQQILYKEQYWEFISKAITDILNPNNERKIYFEQIYTLVYKCVCDGFSDCLRVDLLDKCIAHINCINEELEYSVNMYEGPRKVVATVCALSKAIEVFLSSAQQICSIFGYMNKLHIEEDSGSSLKNTLLVQFCRIVCDHRLEVIMEFIGTCPPFTFQPSDMWNFFSNLHTVSLGHYAKIYPKMFSRYIVKVLPQMSEQDLESYIEEVSRLQAGWRATMESRSSQTGVKRPAED